MKWAHLVTSITFTYMIKNQICCCTEVNKIFTTNYVSVISKSRNRTNVLHLILTANNRGLHHPEYTDIQGKAL